MLTTPTLIEQLQIHREPRGLIGRFFLAVETRLAELGVTMRIEPIEELARIYERNAPSWNGLVPVLDTTIAPIKADVSACLVLYNTDHQAIGSHGCRWIDLGANTIKSAFEDLTFFYGDLAPSFRDTHRCEITARSAPDIRGRIAYHGGFWVHPDWRASDIGRLLPEILQCYVCSQWDIDYELTVGGRNWARPELQSRYGYEHHEPSVRYLINGKPVMQDGLLVFSRIAHARARVMRALEHITSQPTSDEIGRNQQSFVA